MESDTLKEAQLNVVDSSDTHILVEVSLPPMTSLNGRGHHRDRSDILSTALVIEAAHQMETGLSRLKKSPFTWVADISHYSGSSSAFVTFRRRDD